jgi:hypothetical protein
LASHFAPFGFADNLSAFGAMKCPGKTRVLLRKVLAKLRTYPLAERGHQVRKNKPEADKFIPRRDSVLRFVNA